MKTNTLCLIYNLVLQPDLSNFKLSKTVLLALIQETTKFSFSEGETSFLILFSNFYYRVAVKASTILLILLFNNC